jgi:HAD superfamily hydrolase (TIGR01549 family)
MAPEGRSHAVIFDLFGTLVRFDRARVPTLQLPEGPVRSTLPAYAVLLEEVAPGVTPAAFHRAIAAVTDEITRARRASHREVPSRERFARALRRCAVADEALGRAAERLSLAHMAQLAAATVAPAPHHALLARLRRHRAVGCVSNFDHAPTALAILERSGLMPLLDVVIISDAFGLRKPRPEIFGEALRRLGVLPEHALFVGDSPDEDVRGAQGAGLTAVWLNPGGQPPPPGIVPDATIRDLCEIEAVVPT